MAVTKLADGPWVVMLLVASLCIARCAVVGDEFQRVRELLNDPELLLGLRRQLKGVDEAQFVFAYMSRLELGFRLVNVTLTTHRVLSLLASFFVFLVLTFGATAINSLSARQ